MPDRPLMTTSSPGAGCASRIPLRMDAGISLAQAVVHDAGGAILAGDVRGGAAGAVVELDTLSATANTLSIRGKRTQ